MYLEKLVPEHVREAYRKDAWSALLGGLYSGAIFPFIGFIARDRLHSSVAMIGIISASPYAGCLLAIFYTQLMDGRKKMPYLMAAWVIGRAAFILMLFRVTPLIFACIVSFCQIGGSISGPGYAAIIQEIYPNDQRATIMAYIRVGMAFTTLVATLFVGWLLKATDFRYTFAVAGFVGIVCALAFGSIKTSDPDVSIEKQPPHEFFLSTLRSMHENSAFRKFMISVFVFGFANIMNVTLIPIYQVDVLRITPFQVAVLANVSTVAWMLSYPYWGKRVDTASPMHAMIMCIILSATLPINYFLVRNAWWLLPSAVLNGLALSGIELAYFNGVMFCAPEGLETQYQSFHSLSMGVRGVLAPFAATAMIALFAHRHLDLRYAFMIITLCMLAGAVVQLAPPHRQGACGG
jgi:predicted MFS family arabinose efflux permease